MSWNRFLHVAGLWHYIKALPQILLLVVMVYACAIQDEHQDPNQYQQTYLELISENIPDEIEEDIIEDQSMDYDEWLANQKPPQSIEEEIEEYRAAKQKIEETVGDDWEELERSLKELQEEYYVWYSLEDSIFNYYDAEDLQYLFRAVETEVHGGDFESKSHVASVIMNRLEEYGASSFKEIVTAPNQFTYSKKKISDTTLLACEYAFQLGDTAQGALNFHSGSKTDTFSGKNYVFTDSVGHHFYN